jgi:hypothetical protein
LFLSTLNCVFPSLRVLHAKKLLLSCNWQEDFFQPKEITTKFTVTSFPAHTELHCNSAAIYTYRNTLVRHVFLLPSINNLRNCITGKDVMGYLTFTGLDNSIPLPINFPFTEEHVANASKFKTLP